MTITAAYLSPLGELILVSDGSALTGLRFTGQRHFPAGLPAPGPVSASEVFEDTARWLELYFSGERPSLLPRLSPEGTAFQRAVWERLLRIPYGKTVTYAELAAGLGTSARAVGGAVGRNPISLIIPCHRVVGAGGALTGYAGGIGRKEALLRFERGGALPLDAI
ncbi:MAG: methylated-DNA--[Oscillospiraceae bacterium]|nr:methylated-DNA--[protein]-cysteine S-methyltransferase [Oscillospiraceae bacterium]